MTAIPNATIIDVRKTTMQLAQLLATASPGAEIIIADGDKPLARVIMLVEKLPRIGGLNQGYIEVRDDFDDPLPDDFWVGDETAS